MGLVQKLSSEYKKWDKEEILKKSSIIADWAIDRWSK